MQPLIPSDWKYFIVENLQYHGHNITVLYDSDGTKYNVEAGVHVYVNGGRRAHFENLSRFTVSLPDPIIDESFRRKKVENYAANVDAMGYPMPDASFTSDHASTWQAVDGRAVYDYIPSNRWTNWNSKNEKDWFSIDFGPGRTKTIDQVKIYVYSDVVTGEGGVG